MIDKNLIRKHKEVIEARVKAHVRKSKKGKVSNVKQHERDVGGGFFVGDRVVGLGVGPGVVVGRGKDSGFIKIKFDDGPTLLAHVMHALDLGITHEKSKPYTIDDMKSQRNAIMARGAKAYAKNLVTFRKELKARKSKRSFSFDDK